MAGLVAHSGGFSWDEMIVIALPVGVLAILQVVARRKAARARDQDGDPTGGVPGEGARE